MAPEDARTRLLANVSTSARMCLEVSAGSPTVPSSRSEVADIRRQYRIRGAYRPENEKNARNIARLPRHARPPAAKSPNHEGRSVPKYSPNSRERPQTVEQWSFAGHGSCREVSKLSILAETRFERWWMRWRHLACQWWNVQVLLRRTVILGGAHPGWLKTTSTARNPPSRHKSRAPWPKTASIILLKIDNVCTSGIGTLAILLLHLRHLLERLFYGSQKESRMRYLRLLALSDLLVFSTVRTCAKSLGRL